MLRSEWWTALVGPMYPVLTTMHAKEGHVRYFKCSQTIQQYADTVTACDRAQS